MRITKDALRLNNYYYDSRLFQMISIFHHKNHQMKSIININIIIIIFYYYLYIN